MFSSDVRASAGTGVTGVGNASYCGQDSSLTLSAFRMVNPSGGFGVSARTLSGLNGNKPLLALVFNYQPPY